jgi:ribosome modulation factor
MDAAIGAAHQRKDIMEKVYNEGYAAGVHGKRAIDNPYEIDTDEYDAWRDGQSDGNDNAVSAGC